jgi:hypothetical protein
MEMTKFSVAYSDPPWKFNNRNNAHTKFGVGMNIYSGMTVEDIADIYGNYLEPLLAENSAIVTWTVGPKLDQYFQIVEMMKPYGFRHVTKLFSWVKISKSGVERKLPGFYSLSNTEDVQIMVRGSVAVEVKGIGQIITDEFENSEQVFYGEVLKPHSRKPLAIRQHITNMFGLDGERRGLELFARNDVKYAGAWTFVGNEVQETAGMDIKDALKLVAENEY